jgi:hypothetical protein
MVYLPLFVGALNWETPGVYTVMRFIPPRSGFVQQFDSVGSHSKGEIGKS